MATGPPQQHGFVALGTPIGTPKYVRAWGAGRPKTRCFASFPSCLICSARGSSSASAPRPVLTIHDAS